MLFPKFYFYYFALIIVIECLIITIMLNRRAETFLVMVVNLPHSSEIIRKLKILVLLL